MTKRVAPLVTMSNTRLLRHFRCSSVMHSCAYLRRRFAAADLLAEAVVRPRASGLLLCAWRHGQRFTTPCDLDSTGCTGTIDCASEHERQQVVHNLWHTRHFCCLAPFQPAMVRIGTTACSLSSLVKNARAVDDDGAGVAREEGEPRFGACSSS